MNNKGMSVTIAAVMLVGVTVALTLAVAGWVGALSFGWMETESLVITDVSYQGTPGASDNQIVVRIQNSGAEAVTLIKVRMDGYDVDEIIDFSDITLDGGEYYVPTDFNPKVLADGSFAIEIEGKIVALMPKGGYYFDSRYAPLANASERKEIDIILSNRITDEELDFLEAQAREIKNNTDCAILGSFGGNFMEMGHMLFGYQEFMVSLILNKSFIEYFLSKLEEKYLEEIELYLNRVGKCIDIIVLGDDYGTQEGLQISLEMFRQLFKPHLKALCDFIEKRSGVYIFLHSCGSVSKLIPDFIDAGIQILNPVQTSAKGMSPEFLKREFGKDIVFWGGGCDTQRILPFGTLEEVENDVKKRIDIFAPKGGFVFAAIHNIQQEVSPEKCLRLFDTARDYGKYRS